MIANGFFVQPTPYKMIRTPNTCLDWHKEQWQTQNNQLHTLSGATHV